MSVLGILLLEGPRTVQRAFWVLRKLVCFLYPGPDKILATMPLPISEVGVS